MTVRLAAIEFITGCLSVHNTSDQDERLHAAITSGRLNWETVLTIADAQRVTPALWVALRNRGLVAKLPAQVHEYLWKIHLLNTLKNRRLREQVLEAVGQLNSIGVEPVLLKGCISLFVKTFEDPGARVMADLDILVPGSEAKACWDRLRAVGYIPIDLEFDYSRHHHLRPLYRSGDWGVIELHRQPLPASTAALLPSELIWRHAEPIRESGIVMAAPAPTFRILHNLLHSALVSRTYARGDIALRSLHELALTQVLYGKSIDWMTIRQVMDRGGKSKILNAWLYGAHRWFGSPLPDGLRPTFGAVAHYARTRLQARWGWTQEIVDRLLWFSAPDICERYSCNDDPATLARGRVQLAAHLSCKYTRQAFYWARRKFGNLRQISV